MWAKSLNAEGAWLPLWQHLDDAADIAGGLFGEWLSPAVRELIAEPFGADLDAAHAAVTFLAGVHDVGKATPAFAIQDAELACRMREHGLNMPATKKELFDRQRVPHALAGYHLLRRWLLAHGFPPRAVAGWAVIVGGHHGVPPEPPTANDSDPSEYPDLYGEPLWNPAQQEMLDRMARRTGALDHLDRWREAPLTAAFQVVVSGLVIMADWIASDDALLPFHAETLPEAHHDESRSAAALSRLALPPTWAPADAPALVEQLFSTRFDLPAGARPRPVQDAAHDIAEHTPSPGLMVIEAPMGEGKTEAALAAAEVMARRWGCGGVLVALPTQATTDAMFARVVDWLDALGSGDEPVGAITLSHGKARVNRLFQGIVRSGHPTQVGCDEQDTDTENGCGHAVVAHAWLSGRKKSQLANFVVGTIDQLLFAALKSRHLVLRHLALAGKVVIIDEVHAYDAFMNSYLTKVLTWLGAYRVPVIALSATLPADRRAALLDAYQQGRTHQPEPAEEPGERVAYPLISWTGQSRVESREIPASGRHTKVSLDLLPGGVDHDLGPLAELLEDSLSDGGCAVVVRNTVGRVLDTAAVLHRRFPGEVSIAHSRFITADRLRNDDQLLDWFGPPRRGTVRPTRRIVVASQVIEQSLDVDFDLLVTDLAPVDLILQRMGRLHRHDGRERPVKLRRARTVIAGADFGSDPPALERAAADYVYHRFPLLRSAAVLQPRFGGTITLPDDIAPLVAAAYGPGPVGPPEWHDELTIQHRRFLDDIERRTARAADFQIDRPCRPGDAILGWVSGNVGEADDDAQGQGQVRDGARSLEVILVQQGPSGQWTTPDWLPPEQAGIPVPTDRTPNQTVASVLLECTLRLPLALSGEGIDAELRSHTPPPWQHSKLIYRLPAVVIDGQRRGRIGDREISYSPETGLQVLEVVR